MCGCFAGIPDAFTPNGDEKNDFYHPVIENGCTISDYKFGIYNRWGEQVFVGTDPSAKWDGNYKGVPSASGTYMYVLVFSGGISRKQFYFKGDLTLIR